MSLTSALILLVLFQVKHMFADYFLQTPVMLSDRGKYLHVGRALHCSVHLVGSVICLLLLGVPLPLMITVLVVEWLVHYHIDFGKGRWSDRHAHGPHQAAFWRAHGADQMLHQLTYVAMIWAVA